MLKAELDSRIRMLTQENARLRQHQIDSNSQIEAERKMHTATIAHLEALTLTLTLILTLTLTLTLTLILGRVQKDLGAAPPCPGLQPAAPG